MFDQMTYNFPAFLARVAQQKVHAWTLRKKGQRRIHLAVRCHLNCTSGESLRSALLLNARVRLDQSAAHH